MGRVVGIAIAAAIRKTGAQPGLEVLHGRLPSHFTDERSGPLGERAPGAALENAPYQEIKLAGVGGIDHLRVIAAESGQLDLAHVFGPNRHRTIVGLQYRGAVIDISQAEHA